MIAVLENHRQWVWCCRQRARFPIEWYDNHILEPFRRLSKDSQNSAQELATCAALLPYDGGA